MAFDVLGCAIEPRPASKRRREDADNPQFIAAELVGWFAFVAGVAEQCVDRLALVRGDQRGEELDVVGPRSAVDEGRQQQMRFRVADGREFGESPFIMGLMSATAFGKVGRYVTRLQARRVDGRQFGSLADQAAPPGEDERCVKKSLSAPFFSRRLSA